MSAKTIEQARAELARLKRIGQAAEAWAAVVRDPRAPRVVVVRAETSLLRAVGS